MPKPPVSPDRTNDLINEFTLSLTRWGTILFGLWVIAAVWAFYVSLAVFGVDLLNKLKGRPQKVEPHDATVMLVVATVVTAITVVVIGSRVRRVRRLSRRSAEAEGRVISVGRFTQVGLVPVTIAYKVGGLEYTTKRDLMDDEELTEGRAVRVLYDPTDPGSCEIMPR